MVEACEPQQMIGGPCDFAADAHAACHVHTHVFSHLLPSGDVDQLRKLIADGRVGACCTLGKGPHRDNTLLHWAAYHGHAPQAAMLLEAGADRTLTDLRGRTPAEVARAEGRSAVLAVLGEADSEGPGSDLTPLALLERELALGGAQPICNICPEDAPLGFLEAAAACAAERAAGGFDAEGRPGGPYTSAQPPPGRCFAGYLKGCTGAVWGRGEPAEEELHRTSAPDAFCAGEWRGPRKAMFYDKDGARGAGYYRGGKRDNHGGPGSDEEA